MDTIESMWQVIEELYWEEAKAELEKFLAVLIVRSVRSPASFGARARESMSGARPSHRDNRPDSRMPGPLLRSDDQGRKGQPRQRLVQAAQESTRRASIASVSLTELAGPGGRP